MAATLPGCPIVGYYDNEKKDFGGHDKQIDIIGGKWKVSDKTKAYGYVDSTAKIWFQKWTDDGVEHEYLMTEGYLWTSIYEEAKSVIVAGKGQSMELDESSVNGSWAYDDNGWPTFFIINDAMIQKLCILGDDVEPCFEGAGIAAHFSLDENHNELEDFKNQLFSLMKDIKDALSKGGQNPMEKDKNLNPELDPEFKKKDEEEEEKKEDPKSSEEDKKETPPFPPKKDDDKEDNKEDDEEDEKKKKAKNEHSLTDEEVAASDLYKTLFAQFNELQKTVADLKAEIEPLRAFKAETDKKEKQEMIDRFYMLSDEDKKDCIEHIDEYSLDQIEAKLSIICVRNKVSFDLDDDKQDDKSADKKDPMVYNLDNNDDGDSAPAWIKAVRETAKEIE